MHDRKNLGKNMKLDNSTRKAFKSNGFQAEYDGLPALVLPVDSGLATKINQDTGEKSVLPGQIIVVRDHFGTGKLRPNHDGTFDGRKFDVNDPCNLQFRIPRHEGPSLHVSGRNISETTIAILQAGDAVRDDRKRTRQEHQSAMIAWNHARKKGERRPKPERRQNEFDTFKTNVFKDIGGLVRTVEERQQAILADQSAKPDLKAEANGFLDALRSRCHNIPGEFEDERIDDHEKLDTLYAANAELENDSFAQETPDYAQINQKARDDFEEALAIQARSARIAWNDACKKNGRPPNEPGFPSHEEIDALNDACKKSEGPPKIDNPFPETPFPKSENEPAFPDQSM